MIGIEISAVLLAVCMVLLVHKCLMTKREKRLCAQIQMFLRHLSSPAYSVKDDRFAALENAVADLENRILLEQANTAAQSRKNADFVADISHQLKTPLAAIKLYCEMDEGLCPGMHSDKQLVLIEHMESLIHSLLRLENLRADAYTMHFELHGLRDLISDVWGDLHALYPHKEFTLEGDVRLRCDSTWMSEAIANILKNSCEHTPENGKIHVVLEHSEVSVSIRISDNGGGIPSEELPQLFQRFFHSSRNSGKNSAGIGLAITKEIVAKHHGTIFAENTAEGLQILICLPIIDGAQSYEIVR